MSILLEKSEFGKIRMEKRGNDFLFCAKDVCDALGLLDTSMSVKALDDDEKLIQKIFVSGQTREMLFITESGLYALVIRSNKPAARKFRRWITGEVLPALRKYGMYSTDVRVMRRAEERAERKAVKELLREMEDGLSASDRRLVARQCQTDENEVGDVLSGYRQDAYMLMLLYSRVTRNRLLQESFYTQEGAGRLLEALRQEGKYNKKGGVHDKEKGLSGN
ncbi:MAG: Bro-N domain-containing protein [Proteiniphilum sp.]|jgi:prophage antirepressor-like protein|nr:Bro-N domain-containing protein [Proteiniphilum sp.]